MRPTKVFVNAKFDKLNIPSEIPFLSQAGKTIWGVGVIVERGSKLKFFR